MVPTENAVATLVSHPSQPAVDADLIARVRRALGDGAESTALASGIAADIVGYGEPTAIERTVREVLGDRPVDVIVQPLAGRRKRLFLADMDSTMIGQECIDELADFVGLKAEVSEITERAMRGEMEFEPALKSRVALLKDLSISVIDEIMTRRITLNQGARALVRTMRANGAYTCLVSGGFTLFTEPVAALVGFHEHRSNELSLLGGKLTGAVVEPILGREAKLAALVELREKLSLPAEAVMAVGDGANDLAMLGEAGLGVAYRAKPPVAAAAHARIEYADLTALLYCQGYRGHEIAQD
jgi:phosphoserine phosphatase